MPVKMSQIMDAIEEFAPLHLAEDWDNVGLLVGRRGADISKALVALDALDGVIEEAIVLGANAIITHHPLIYQPINRINDDSPLGCRLLRLTENNICLYCAHTNLDMADGGINDMLFEVFGLQNKEQMCAGRAGILPGQMTLSDFAIYVKNTLGLSVATYCGDGESEVRKVGIIGGSSANVDFFQAVLAAGCDTFVTADIKFAAAQAALDMGLSLVDATHYGSEVIFAERLAKYLESKIKDVDIIVSNVNGQIFNTISC